MKHPRWESNPDLQIRSLPFYPLNYGGVRGVIIIDLEAVSSLSYFRHKLSYCRSGHWRGDRTVIGVRKKSTIETNKPGL
jgi:hypothetical protein